MTQRRPFSLARMTLISALLAAASGASAQEEGSSIALTPILIEASRTESLLGDALSQPRIHQRRGTSSSAHHANWRSP